MKNKNKYPVCHLFYEEFPRDPRVRRYVNALNEQDIKCIVICSKKKGDAFFENRNGNLIYRIPVSKKRSSFFLTFLEYFLFAGVSSLLLLYLFIRYRYRIIHVHTLPDFLIFSALTEKLLGVKTILDLHELFPELYMVRTGKGPHSTGARLLKIIEKLSVKMANRVVTIHNNAKNIFIARNKGLENKISVIMNGVDPEEFTDTKRTETDDFIIIYNGTINRIMNLEIIPDALNILKNSMPGQDFIKIKFRLYGDGPAVGEILESAKSFGLNNCVEYCGFLQPEKMNKEILKSSVLVLPPLKNLYSDLFYTIKLVEMVYLRIPVIATRLNTYELYYGEDSLFYFDSGNTRQLSEKIREVFYNKTLIAQKTENAFNNYMKVSWDKMKLIYIKIIFDLLNRKFSLQQQHFD